MSQIRISGPDLGQAYTDANTGAAIVAPVYTLTTGTTTTGYTLNDLQTWNSARPWRGVCDGAGHMNIDLDIVGSFGAAYNAVVVIAPYLPVYVASSGSAGVFVKAALYSGAAFAPATPESSILAADLNDGDVLTIGRSRVWVFPITSAASLSPTGAGRYLRVFIEGGAAMAFGAAHIAVVNMQDPFTTLDLSIMSDVAYNWVSRDLLTELESGGFQKVPRPFVREVTFPVEMAGKIGQQIARITQAQVTDSEPILIALDWASELVAGGQHTQTFPAKLINDISITLKPQFSRSAFVNGNFGLTYREFR